MQTLVITSMQMLIVTYMQMKNEHCLVWYQRRWCWVHKCRFRCRFRCRLIFWWVCNDYWRWVFKAKVGYEYEYDSGYAADADAHADAEADHINSPPLLCKLQSSSLAESSFSPSLSPTAPLTHWVFLFIRMHLTKERLWYRLTQKFYKLFKVLQPNSWYWPIFSLLQNMI